MRVTVDPPLPKRPPVRGSVVGAVAVPRTRLPVPKRLPVEPESEGKVFVARLLEVPRLDPLGFTRVRPSPLELDGRSAGETEEAREVWLLVRVPIALVPTEPVPTAAPLERVPKDDRREVDEGSADAGVTVLRWAPRLLPERELPTLELPVVDREPNELSRWGGSTPPKRGVTDRIGPEVLVVAEPLPTVGVTLELPPAAMRLELG